LGIVEQAFALGILHRFKQPVEHDYVLAGKNRLASGLRPYSFNEIDVMRFRAILEDYAVWQTPPESRRRCDVYLCRVGRAEMQSLKHGRSPEICVFANSGNSNGVRVKSIRLRYILVNAVQPMRDAQQFASLGKTQYGSPRHTKTLGLGCSEKAIVSDGLIENNIICSHGT